MKSLLLFFSQWKGDYSWREKGSFKGNSIFSWICTWDFHFISMKPVAKENFWAKSKSSSNFLVAAVSMATFCEKLNLILLFSFFLSVFKKIKFTKKIKNIQLKNLIFSFFSAVSAMHRENDVNDMKSRKKLMVVKKMFSWWKIFTKEKLREDGKLIFHGEIWGWGWNLIISVFSIEKRKVLKIEGIFQKKTEIVVDISHQEYNFQYHLTFLWK